MILHHREWGPAEGSTVFCVHGVGQQSEIFAVFGELVAASGRRVVALDLRGHGDSPAATASFADHVADLAETAAALDPARADWVGHSFGGRACAALAAAHPERVRSLALLEPAFEVPAERIRQAVLIAGLDWSFETRAGAAAALLAAEGSVGAAPQLVADYLERDLRRGDDGRFRFSSSGTAVAGVWEAMAGPNPPVATVPTLLLSGAESHLADAAGRERYARALGPLLTERTVDGGHNVLWSAPTATTEAITDFLAATDAGDGNDRPSVNHERSRR
ncbi:MAG TPA: alpha/beta hydrolase [Solirubrobacterales bacterium]|nr:alpha/beta hydrolase [Solirubrobacterales bacterium]